MGGMAMHCMKCGRDISDDQVFCNACLELMAQHPVKADVVVQLPQRRAPVQKKYTSRRRIRSVDEQLLRTKRTNRWLIGIVSLLVLFSIATSAMSLYLVRQLDAQKSIGQNDSTIEEAE